MKRLLAIILAVACALLAQGSLLGFAKPSPPCACCGCGSTGDCGQSDCALPATSPSQGFISESTVSVAAVRATPAARTTRTLKFFESFATASAPWPLPAPCATEPAASEPLFKVHCSYLV